jgi:acyl-coenzyme A thioesterase PaaI-like protein
MAKSLQEQYAPTSICFGCGPANEKGLRIGSRVEGETLVAEWTPEKHHEAFPNVVNGGIIGSLLDCHSNWTAAHHLMTKQSLDHLPCTVTSDFHVKLLRPTPSGGKLFLKAWVKSDEGGRVVIEATLTAGEKVCATCTGTFVAVKPGHPAYFRW